MLYYIDGGGGCITYIHVKRCELWRYKLNVYFYSKKDQE